MFVSITCLLYLYTFNMNAYFIFKVCTILYGKNMDVKRIIIYMKTLNQINSTMKKPISIYEVRTYTIYILYYTTSCLQYIYYTYL